MPMASMTTDQTAQRASISGEGLWFHRKMSRMKVTKPYMGFALTMPITHKGAPLSMSSWKSQNKGVR